MELLEHPPRGAHPAAEGVTDAGEGRLDQRLGPQDESGQHAHPVAQHAAIGRMVNGRLDTGAIDAQFAGMGDLGLAGQLGRPVGQRVQGVGLNGLRPAQQRGLSGHALEVDAAKPTQH